MMETITYIQKEGPFFDRRLRLIEFGIDHCIIKIHPDDILDSNIEQLIELGYKAQLMNYHEIKLDVFKGYGAKVIGVMLVQMSMSKLILLVKLKSQNMKPHYRISNFNSLKKKVICSILDQFTPDILPEWLWVLSINDGRLGLQDYVSVAYTAYSASFIDCLPTCEEVCPNLLESNNRCAACLNTSITYINIYCHSLDPGVQIITIASLRSLRSVGNNALILHHYLTYMLENSTRKAFLETLDNKHLGWFSSVSNEMASRWLSVLPKCPSFTFESSPFRILLAM